jgi:hypothetical protein
MRMFQWFNFVGASTLVNQLRITTQPLQEILPLWIQFSLPNALWVYSLTGFMALVWSETNSRTKAFWLSLGLVLGVGLELGQYIQLIPGVFDAADFTLCILAAPLALLTTSNLLAIKRRPNDFTA